MVKYAAHNNGGKLELIRCASFLGRSVELIENLLELFEQTEFIEILDRNSLLYSIKLLGKNDLNEILTHPKFLDILNISEECELFQNMLLEDDLEQILSDLV